VFDHGFLYGDGVFEGIRAYEGNVFRLKEHIERLYRSAKTIALDLPMTQAELTQAVLETIASERKKDAYSVDSSSRGPGDLGIDPGQLLKPTIVYHRRRDQA
jgi:branched-chain amino acid aminotransferase